MKLTAAQFIDSLERQKLLSPQLISSLRQQVQKSAKPISAAAIAKLLVDKGHLAAPQAKQLLAGEQPPPALDDEFAPTTPLWDDLLADSQSGPSWDDSTLAESGSPLKPIRPQRGWKRLFGAKPSSSKPNLKSQWESPLMLIGGGGLVTLLILGAALLYFLRRDGGDQLFNVADEYYLAGSYTQAIPSYAEFISDYPSHPDVSRARVNLGLARIRQAISTKQDANVSLETAQKVLPEIEDEPAFFEAREQLRSILPDIAEALAQEAQSHQDADQKKQYVVLAEEALTLVANTKYVLKSHRPTHRLEAIEELLATATRDLDRNRKLHETIEAMQQAAEDGDTQAAYQLRKQLLKTYPNLADNLRLASVVREIAEAEKEAVPTRQKRIESVTSEPETPILAEVALTERRGQVLDNISDEQVVLIKARGAVYALQLNSGRVLWRQFVGVDPQLWPSRIQPTGVSSDALLIDSSRNELVRREAYSGKLVWRFTAAEPLLNPVQLGEQILLTSRNGKVWAINSESGDSPQQLQLTQGVRVPPLVHPRENSFFVIGEHSNVYLISPEDFSCRQVIYLGHEAGTISTPPVWAVNYLVVAENWGRAACKLHVLAADAEGQALEPVQQIPLTGHVVTPPIVFGRRMVVATDHGQVIVFEIGQRDTGRPLTQVAERVPSRGSPAVRYLEVEDEKLWIADTELSRFAIQYSSGRLVPEAIDSPQVGDAFDSLLQISSGTLIHTRRRVGLPGVTVAAVGLQLGNTIWETDVAVPPADQPIVTTNSDSAMLVNATGALYEIDVNKLEAGVIEQPLRAENPWGATVLTARVDLGIEQFAFAPGRGGSQMLLYENGSAQPLKWITLPSALAACPTAIEGELLMPLHNQQIAMIDPLGESSATPFQPRLSPGKPIAWTAPAAVPNGKSAIVSDNIGRLFRLAIKDEPSRHLAAIAENSSLGTRITSSIAVLNDMAFAIDDEGYLCTFDVDQLKLVDRLNVRGQAIWGPIACGTFVLLVTDHEELIALDANQKIKWQRPLEHGLPVGKPMVDRDSIYLASQEGTVCRVAADSGEIIAKVDTYRPLATGPIAFGARLLLTGDDGTLYVIDRP